MTAAKRSTTAILAAATVLIALTGCSLFNPELARDENGRVLEPAIIGSTSLLVGDCFTFVDGSDLSEAEVTPCVSDHTHIVIGKGELAKTEISEAGGLQNAVSTSCSETFSAFKETVVDRARPDQEFIVSERTAEDGVVTTHYACIATDAPAPEA